MSLCVPKLWVAISPYRSSFSCVRSPQLCNNSCFRRQKKPPRVAVAVAVTGAELVEDGKAVVGLLLQIVDPWAPTVGSGININSQSLASQLFAASLFPYLGFLYHITRSNSSPKLTLFGFYFLLAFVAATIPAGIYAKLKYGTSLANVDWLHGGAESLLTLTNLFIVLGLRKAVRENNEETSVAENEDTNT
ncbi:hypothetical protein GOP47_0005987 [Adiantum capillus-veneris]|uniref:Uncharacterized protein n=1 Tax=Adiantum capillus-veneris TaxID=13818 RepID=A0A9D4V212_ADICA|nr:hypothetical protein GOP47_0005987 [Adiantum capillus-veneris]